jgi:hypothetical protein
VAGGKTNGKLAVPQGALGRPRSDVPALVAKRSIRELSDGPWAVGLKNNAKRRRLFLIWSLPKVDNPRHFRFWELGFRAPSLVAFQTRALQVKKRKINKNGFCCVRCRVAVADQTNRCGMTTTLLSLRSSGWTRNGSDRGSRIDVQ